jgi:LPXTG-motif cell wall-anchored protein
VPATRAPPATAPPTTSEPTRTTEPSTTTSTTTTSTTTTAPTTTAPTTTICEPTTGPGGGQLPSTGSSPAHLLVAGLLLGGGGLTIVVGARSRAARCAK